MVLPVTGTAELLDLLSPFVPDDFIDHCLPRHRGSGRRCEWSSAQLYRSSLLLLLSTARSTNLLAQLLGEQRDWRRFAHIPNGRHWPNARQLHEFRGRLSPSVLRRINEHLLQPILRGWPSGQPGVGLIDATDLPAATNEYKKRVLPASPHTEPKWAHAQRRPDRAAGSLDIRNTRFDSGFPSTRRRCCSSR